MMRILLLPPFLLFQAGGTNSDFDHCQGCDDESAPPQFIDTVVGSCVSYTTAEITLGRDGLCHWTGTSCNPEPCHPELVLRHHQASNGNGISMSGIIGDVRFGPIKMPGGQDIEIYRGGVTLACGGQSPYYFEITSDCADTDGVEEIYGWFTCTTCRPR